MAFKNNNNIFWAFVKKEFYHISRDRWTVVILLILPIVMLLLFGYALNTEVKNSGLAVYDPSNDAVTRAIIDKLQINDYFVLKKVLHNQDDIENAFQKGDIGMVVVFSDDFQKNIVHGGNARIQLIADGSDPNTASILATYATTIIAGYQKELMKTDNLPYQITPDVKFLYNPSMKTAYNFVPGVMGMILLLICAMMTSISIAREKENGTMEVLLASPMKPLYVILSKTVPYFVLSLVNLTTILLMAVFIMKVPIAGSLFWLLAISLLYIFVALALGILISTLMSSQVAAMLVSGVVLMFPVLLLSGMIFPIENMPLFLRILSDIIPAKWFIIAVKKLMIKGLGLSSILLELSILGAMAVFFISVSLKKFKIRLE